MAAKAPAKSGKKDPVPVSRPKARVSVPPPPPPKPLPLDERAAVLDARLGKTSDDFQRAYRESFDMSWIYHDSALEGVVYTQQELQSALDPTYPIPPDSSIQPTCEEIRRHREALEFVRDAAVNKKKVPITVDLVKKLFLILHPDEGDLKTVRYRKDIPQHRLYFHEYAPPDKINYKVRQVVDWVNDPETKKSRGAVRIAARAHYDLLRVFPFAVDSGKVARMLMNLLLLRAGFPPAIIHSTERQRYYEALKGSSSAMTQIVQESLENSVSSIEKLLDGQEHRVQYVAR